MVEWKWLGLVVVVLEVAGLAVVVVMFVALQIDLGPVWALTSGLSN